MFCSSGENVHLSCNNALSGFQVTTLNSLIRGLYMNDSHFNRFIHILLESGDEDMQLIINLDSMKLPSRSTRRLLEV